MQKLVKFEKSVVELIPITGSWFNNVLLLKMLSLQETEQRIYRNSLY